MLNIFEWENNPHVPVVHDFVFVPWNVLSDPGACLQDWLHMKINPKEQVVLLMVLGQVPSLLHERA